MKKLMIVSLVLVCLMLTSCATMFDDDTSAIIVNSEPSGAIVRVDGYPMGTTPTTLILENDSTHVIEFSKEGYVTESARVKKSVRWGWQVLDIFTTGIIGNIIDLTNGKGYKLTPDKINMTLIAQ